MNGHMFYNDEIIHCHYKNTLPIQKDIARIKAIDRMRIIYSPYTGYKLTTAFIAHIWIFADASSVAEGIDIAMAAIITAVVTSIIPANITAFLRISIPLVAILANTDSVSCQSI